MHDAFPSTWAILQGPLLTEIAQLYFINLFIVQGTETPDTACRVWHNPEGSLN